MLEIVTDARRALDDRERAEAIALRILDKGVGHADGTRMVLARAYLAAVERMAELQAALTHVQRPVE